MQWISFLPSSGEYTAFHQYTSNTVSGLKILMHELSLKGKLRIILSKSGLLFPLYSFIMNPFCKIIAISDVEQMMSVTLTVSLVFSLQYCLEDQLNKHLTDILLVLELRRYFLLQNKI